MTTQPTPSPHQHEPAPFTTGPCIHLGGDRGVYTKLNDGCRGLPIAMVNSIDPVSHANAKLIAACFNASTALWQAGYDSQKVIEALPEIMRMFTNYLEGQPRPMNDRINNPHEERAWVMAQLSQLRRTRGTK